MATTISPTPADLGQVTSKVLHSYSVTSDTTMQPVIERINGVTVGRKNLSSGQRTTTYLTKEQWGAIPFGKYRRMYENLLGEEGKCESIDTITTSSSIDVGNDSDNMYEGEASVFVSRKSTSSGKLTLSTQIHPKMNGECYLGIAMVYMDDDATTTGTLGFSVTRSGTYLETTQLSEVYTADMLNTDGDWIPIIAKIKVEGIPESDAYFTPTITISGFSTGDYFNIDGIRLFKIPSDLYNSLNPIATIADGQKLSDAFPMDTVAGKLNTLTIEMGTNKWEYTFDKRLANDVDFQQVIKSSQDFSNTYLPNVKKQLIDAFNEKGSSIADDANWKAIIDGVKAFSGINRVTGTLTSSTSTKSFTRSNASTYGTYYVTIDTSKLPFAPNQIYIRRTDKTGKTPTTWRANSADYFASSGDFGNTYLESYVLRIPYVSSGFMDIPVSSSGISYTWEAIS